MMLTPASKRRPSTGPQSIRKAGELARGFTPKLAALDTVVFLAGLVRLSLLDRARDGVRKNVGALIRSHVQSRRA